MSCCCFPLSSNCVVCISNLLVAWPGLNPAIYVVLFAVSWLLDISIVIDVFLCIIFSFLLLIFHISCTEASYLCNCSSFFLFLDIDADLFVFVVDFYGIASILFVFDVVLSGDYVVGSSSSNFCYSLKKKSAISLLLFSFS